MQSEQPRVLRIGTAGSVTSLDPHFHNYGPNTALNIHIFDRLTYFDKGKMAPALAVSWEPEGHDKWKVGLRKDVYFHNGKKFTSQDVVNSFARIPTLSQSPSSFMPYIRGIKKMTIIDDYHLIFETYKSEPLLPNFLSMIAIVSTPLETTQNTETNSDHSLSGTGPYQLVKWTKGSHIELRANEKFWSGPPQWDIIKIIPIENDSARISALLSGDVDIIDNVPTESIPLLDNKKDFSYQTYSSGRLIYLQLDQFRDESPYVYAGNKSNPLKIQKVRKAISYGINRDDIVHYIMKDLAMAAGQIVPEGFSGFAPHMLPDRFDPQKAQELLQEAGYGEGFSLTLHAPNDRYVNDEKIAYAVASMLTKINIDTKVETLPKTIFFSQASDLKFSFMLLGWASGTGDAFSPLKSLIHSVDSEQGYGVNNRGHYKNDHVDKLIEMAAITIDQQKRESLMQQATQRALDEAAIIPLHFQVNAWGYRSGLTYLPRYMSHIWAESVLPVQ